MEISNKVNESCIFSFWMWVNRPPPHLVLVLFWTHYPNLIKNVFARVRFCYRNVLKCNVPYSCAHVHACRKSNLQNTHLNLECCKFGMVLLQNSPVSFGSLIFIKIKWIKINTPENYEYSHFFWGGEYW